jgi:hypothetical protein
MTVLFDIKGADWPTDNEGVSCPPAQMFVNVANANARDFLDWIGLAHEPLWGEIDARELAALLRRRLWPEIRTRDDAGRAPLVEHRMINFGREPGRLASYAERLLLLAECAGEGTITWG